MGRNLNKRSYEVLGVDQKIWASLETGGYGKNATGGLVPAGTDAIEHINAGIVFDIPREDSAARSGRSAVVRLSGKKSVEISYEGYIIPGTPDVLGNPTLPPIHPFLLSAFGQCDTSDPTKIVYKLTSLNSNTFRMLEEATHYSRLATGCVAEGVTFSFPGDGKAQVKVEGFGQDVFGAGESLLTQAATGVAQKALKVIQNLTFTAKSDNSSGNLVSIKYNAGGTAGAEVVSVVGNAISVQIETGESTAAQIKAAIEASVSAMALLDSVAGVSTDPQVVFTPAVYLEGGLGADELKVETNEGQKYEVGAYIDVIDNDGSTVKNSKKKIIAISGDILKVDTALVASDVGDFVIGHAPEAYDPISSEFALLGLKGSFSFQGSSLPPCEAISAEISVKNNYTKKDFLFGTSSNCGYIPDKRREIGVKMELLLNRENYTIFMNTKKFIAQNVLVTLEPQDIPAPSFDSSTGRTFEFHMPRVEFNIPPIEQPGDKYVTLSLEGKALAVDSDDLDTELTLTIK